MTDSVTGGVHSRDVGRDGPPSLRANPKVSPQLISRLRETRIQGQRVRRRVAGVVLSPAGGLSPPDLRGAGLATCRVPLGSDDRMRPKRPISDGSRPRCVTAGCVTERGAAATDSSRTHEEYEKPHPREIPVMNPTISDTPSNPPNSSSRPSARGGTNAGRPRRPVRVRGGAAGYGRLASPRDRQAARDRNTAERARVEEMLASAPLPSDRRRARWTPPVTPTLDSPAETSRDGSKASRLRALPTMPAGCPVCESTKVTSDEVARPGGSLRLSECLHCDHRWTEKPVRRFAELGGAMGRRRPVGVSAAR